MAGSSPGPSASLASCPVGRVAEASEDVALPEGQAGAEVRARWSVGAGEEAEAGESLAVEGAEEGSPEGAWGWTAGAWAITWC